MKLKEIHLGKLLLLSSLAVSAWGAEDVPFKPEKSTDVRAVDTTQSNSIVLDVSIFGDGAIGSYYILWSDVDLSDEMKQILTTRDFARDEFFMQNIDREQFEQERLLQLFEDKKREYFKIFPEDEFIKDPDEEDDQRKTTK
jgi:hypothetical protein